MQFLKNGLKGGTHSSKWPMGIAIDPPEGLTPERATTVLKMGNFTHSIGGIFVLQYLSRKCTKWDNQGQFKKVQNLRSSKLSLVVQFDAFLA